MTIATVIYYQSIVFKFEGNIMKNFKILFSTLSEEYIPHTLENGKFNCSVSHYSKFQEHVHCNLKRECGDGQDETEYCPFSSTACQGLVASRNKCYLLSVVHINDKCQFAQYACSAKGGSLAMFKNRQEQNDFLYNIDMTGIFQFCVGFVSGWKSVSFPYSRTDRWSDKAIIYNMNHLELGFVDESIRFYSIYVVDNMKIAEPTSDCRGMVCEIKVQSPTVAPAFIQVFYKSL